MKFLADMGISPRSVSFLRDLGYEAVHLHELGLERLPDAQILIKARREGYVVLTHDVDFGELVALGGARLPSVVIFRLRNRHPRNVNHYLRMLVTDHQPALEEGAICSVTESHIRVRALPLEI